MNKPHRSLYISSLLARTLSRVLNRWPLFLVAAFFASPVGPHLLYEYRYREAFGQRSYMNCTYLGSRGFVTPGYIEDCPVIVWLDSRGGGW